MLGNSLCIQPKWDRFRERFDCVLVSYFIYNGDVDCGDFPQRDATAIRFLQQESVSESEIYEEKEAQSQKGCSIKSNYT